MKMHVGRSLSCRNKESTEVLFAVTWYFGSKIRKLHKKLLIKWKRYDKKYTNVQMHKKNAILLSINFVMQVKAL